MSRKIAFIANQKFFHQQKTLRTSLKATFLRTKTSFARAFLRCPQKIPIFTNQKPFFCTNLSLLPSKTTLFHHKHRKFPPSHNLLSTKEHGHSFIVRSNSLRCKAGTSHRFKSLPAIPGEVAAFRKTGYRMIAGHFRNNHVSTGDLNRPRSPEVRKPLGYSPFFSYKRKE